MPMVARLHKLSIKLGKCPSCAGLNISLDGLDLFQHGSNELVRSLWRLVTARCLCCVINDLTGIALCSCLTSTVSNNLLLTYKGPIKFVQGSMLL